MTVIQVRSFHEHFRECQHSEWLSLGEKALDNSYGEEVQCSVKPTQSFFPPFLYHGAIVKSIYDLPEMFQGILHISLG